MPFSHQDRMHHVSDEQWPWGHLYIPVGLYACGLLPKCFFRSDTVFKCFVCACRQAEREKEKKTKFTCWSKACACALVIALVACTACRWKSSPFVWAPGKSETGSCWIDQSHKIPFQLTWLVHSLSGLKRYSVQICKYIHNSTQYGHITTPTITFKWPFGNILTI